MLEKLNREANIRMGRTQTNFLQQNEQNISQKSHVNMSNYNSNDCPENTYSVKKVINQINDPKRVQYQKHRYSSFDAATIGGTNQKESHHNHLHFYLNRDRISSETTLDTHKNEIVPIDNDWQDPSIIPKLENGLDVILKNPGIYPVETINHYNKNRLGTFFTRLPQYSQINESCISPYYPPG